MLQANLIKGQCLLSNCRNQAYIRMKEGWKHMNLEKKILVIDDEEGIRDWLSFELGRQGYLVSSAQSGKEGIERIKKERFDIAIVDIMMPEMNGVAVLEQIKKIDSDIEVIISTGYGTIELA